MIRFKNIEDAQSLKDDPELWREVHGYMCVCQAEILEVEDEDYLKGHDFNFAVAGAADIAYLESLGQPEESVTIELNDGVETLKVYRWVFTTEVIFFGDDVASKLSVNR